MAHGLECGELAWYWLLQPDKDGMCVAPTFSEFFWKCIALKSVYCLEIAF